MEYDYIKVKDKDYLYRDLNSEAIVNSDHEGYQKYIQNYKTKIKETERINTLENDVSSIRSDLDEIKNLLRNFVNESK
jgi:hypothetical protein